MRSWWLAGAAAVAGLVLAPLAALAITAFQGSDDLWQHLIAYVLPEAVRETLLLLAGVGALGAALGTGLAWLVTAHDFPGRRLLTWALLLPLAVPTYIVAYAYLDILHPVGPVQSAVRALLGVESPREFRLPDVRSMAGCIVLLGFVLYPYVYLATRALFLMQSAPLLEAARTLGSSRRAAFFRVALPLARPAIAVGTSLALLEALNDIGASEFLGVRTLTVAVYTTWATRADLPGAAQIALAMLVVVTAIIVLERHGRRKRSYAAEVQHARPLAPVPLRGRAGLLALAAGLLPIGIGFLVPVGYLAYAAWTRLRAFGLSPAILEETVNTVLLSAAGTLLTIGAGLVVVYAARLHRGRATGTIARIASLGYAVPGIVLALGLLPVVAKVHLVLLSSGAAIVLAYVIRFLAIGAGGIESGFSRVPMALDDAASTLGEPAGRRLWRVHVPIIRPALLSAALLVFVDCMKELPATLLLRPLGFETLATHLYGEAVRGTYEDAAIAALLIVAAGLLPTAVLARTAELGVRR